MGYLFVISGPSGVGKSTVIESLLHKHTDLSRVITCTSRAPRVGERLGKDYYFFSKEIFLEKVNNGEFIEYSEVFGNYYGVLLSTIEENMRKYDVSILVINWEGFLKIKKLNLKNVYGIFINPPSVTELENRIRSRHTDAEESILRRLGEAQNDMSYADYYDFVVVNQEIADTADAMWNIIREISHL